VEAARVAALLAQTPAGGRRVPAVNT